LITNLKPNLPKDLKEISSSIPHPEGITLDQEDNIYVSSASSGNIFILNGNQINVHVNTKGRPLGIAFSDNLNCLIVADALRKSILRVSLGNASISKMCDSYMGLELNGPSDLIINQNQDVIFTDPLKIPYPNPCISPVYKLNNRHELEIFIPDLAFPSGITISENKVFISETRANRLVVLENNDEEKIEPQMFRRFAEPGNPDGLTVDDEGNIYQTLPGIGAIAVVDKDGQMKEIYHMESWKPSNIHFKNGVFYVTDRLGSRIFKFSK
jgi:sugar lactone lactonase YvrE|tara:strand:+ start:6482 stop:7288 length:807 start_codon:yes stop_codon:yes gene_type:complete